MALIRLEHVPEKVRVNSTLHMILPEPGDMKDIPVKDRNILYLLHGLSDDSSAWQRFSAVESYAKRYGLVIIMPSVGRSFYLDMPNGQEYFSYLVDELPHYLQNVFGISTKRENTAIAGLSMGGYGAYKAAFHYPERYFAACSLSGVLSIDILHSMEDPIINQEFTGLFGDLSRIAGSQHDPLVWLQNASGKKTILPRLILACGKQDPLYPLNLQFLRNCREMEIPVEYSEFEGGHDWSFWDKQIQRLFEILYEPQE